MKRFLIFFSLYLISSLLLSGGVFAQNLGQYLEDLKKEMGEITIDKTTYTQSLEVLDAVKGKIRYESIAVNDKGVSTKEAYELYISDIDKNTLLRKPSGKKFFVSFWLNNKQKFIKHYENDKFNAYTDNVEMLVLGPDIAQNVIDILKSAIPLVKTTEKNWKTATEALSWLKTNVGEVPDKSGTRQQTFAYNNDNVNLLELTVKTTGSKGDVIEEKYNWNITDLNKDDIKVKISGSSLNVAMEIKNGNKYVRYLKNNELQNYVSSIEIASDDIEHARNVISALSAAFDKSNVKATEFKTPQIAIEFLKNHVVDAASDQKTRSQKIDFAGNSVKCTFISNEQDSKGKSINNQYEFYLTDADPNISFNVSGKKVIVPVSMLGNFKFIRYQKDNNLQNYEEKFEIYMPDIESAREVVAAFKSAINGSKEAPMKFTSNAEAMKFLQANIEGTTVGTDQYQLSFEGKAAEPYACTYKLNKTDAKGVTTDESFVFYPYMFDVNSVKIEPDGKYITINTLVAGKKSFVKNIKKEKNSFVSELSVMSFDVKKAKDIASAFRFLIANTNPKEKAFANKQAALEFLKQNTKELKSGDKSIKQAIDVASDNPCKLILTTNTTDGKGKTTEQIYEFTLLDINKNLTEFKPSGENISVVLSCKNKQKLVKSYKDGQQQSFSTDVELYYDDVEVAKNVSEAIKFAVGTCE